MTIDTQKAGRMMLAFLEDLEENHPDEELVGFCLVATVTTPDSRANYTRWSSWPNEPGSMARTLWPALVAAQQGLGDPGKDEGPSSLEEG